MSILIDKHTRVITQGIATDAGRLHTALCRGYGNGRHCFVAGVQRGHSGEQLEGLPIFDTVREAREKTGGAVSVVYEPAAAAAAAIVEAIDAGVEMVICITDGLPAAQLAACRARARRAGALLLGPASPGVITPGELKIGVMPGEAYHKGRIGIVARSGASGAEAAGWLADLDFGESTAVGIGRDGDDEGRVTDLLRRFDGDERTDAVVLVADIGDAAEEACARWAKGRMHKPVIGFVSGDEQADEAVRRSLALMEDCGIKVARNPAEIARLLESALAPRWLPFD